ncbi:MAG TPA: YukJ family protein [Acidobacteriaceae bacterium]
MPVYKYSVLKGNPLSGKLSADAIPHYLIEVEGIGTTWEIAVNVESSDGSEVLYLLNENFTPPDVAALQGLGVGITSLAGLDANPAIDYLRSQVNSSPLVIEQQMTPLPLPGDPGSGTLKNAVLQFLNQAIADKEGMIYAFGSQYTQGDGVHDIHMNQGNPPGSFSKDNGIWQDGMLLFELPATSTWAAIFLAFQDEAWMTDENGNPD